MQTAEIIALLYEATQGPPIPVDEPPALNPTGGVTGKQPPPLNGLQFKKDPSRQGSGVFIAHGITRKEDYNDMPDGTIVPSSEAGSDGMAFKTKLHVIYLLKAYLYHSYVLHLTTTKTASTSLHCY